MDSLLLVSKKGLVLASAVRREGLFGLLPPCGLRRMLLVVPLLMMGWGGGGGASCFGRDAWRDGGSPAAMKITSTRGGVQC